MVGAPWDTNTTGMSVAGGMTRTPLVQAVASEAEDTCRRQRRFMGAGLAASRGVDPQANGQRVGLGGQEQQPYQCFLATRPEGLRLAQGVLDAAGLGFHADRIDPNP